MERQRQDLAMVALCQGAYFLLTGIWPLGHMRSFLAVTGPKTDLWLVRTVAALVSAIGVALIVAGLKRQVTSPVAVLAIGSGIGLASIDAIYVRKGTISRIYLADALLELVLCGAWFAAWRGHSTSYERPATDPVRCCRQ